MSLLAQETVNKLLDFNQKLDIGLLDTVVGTLYSGTGDQQKMAQEVLTTLKEHPDAWTKVRTLLIILSHLFRHKVILMLNLMQRSF
jgi:exportin-1